MDKLVSNLAINGSRTSIGVTPLLGLLGETDDSDLAWVIPIILVAIAACIGLALLLFYCLRSWELCCIRCLYRYCGGCADTIHRKYQSENEEYRRLRENEETGVKMSMTEFNRSYSGGYRNMDYPDV